MNQNVIDNDNVKNEALSNVNEVSASDKASNDVSTVSTTTETKNTENKVAESSVVGDVKETSSEKKENKVETAKEEKVEDVNGEKGSNIVPIKSSTEKEDEIKLTHLNEDFVYELMSIPTLSESEYRLVTFVILWARRNGIKYEFDTYGNVYLTKGEVAEGEYYPCVTAHLDSVQQKHKMYAQAGQPLEVKTRISNKKHEIYVDGMGIGGDDKAGVLIGLSMFSHVDKLKACFFLEEETGCRGSKNLNVDWFKNVGYVLGYDSPDLNRAAYACSGTRLFSADFFKKHMQDICKKHGLTKFHSEPFTDVKEIREKTNIICMNFGSGYYNGHMPNEYCVIEDMDTACRMGHELIEHLGLKRYELEHKSTSSSWVKMADGSYKKPEVDEDEKFLSSLSGYGPYGNYGGSSTTGVNKTTQTTNTTSHVNSTAAKSTTETKTTVNNADMVEMETLEYISNRYEEYISMLKDNVKNICGENNIDFDKIFAKAFEFEIKF